MTIAPNFKIQLEKYINWSEISKYCLGCRIYQRLLYKKVDPENIDTRDIISTAATVSEITDPSDAAIPLETTEEGMIGQGILNF